MGSKLVYPQPHDGCELEAGRPVQLVRQARRRNARGEPSSRAARTSSRPRLRGGRRGHPPAHAEADTEAHAEADAEAHARSRHPRRRPRRPRTRRRAGRRPRTGPTPNATTGDGHPRRPSAPPPWGYLDGGPSSTLAPPAPEDTPSPSDDPVTAFGGTTGGSGGGSNGPGSNGRLRPRLRWPRLQLGSGLECLRHARHRRPDPSGSRPRADPGHDDRRRRHGHGVRRVRSRRRDGEPPAPDEVLAAEAALGISVAMAGLVRSAGPPPNDGAGRPARSRSLPPSPPERRRGWRCRAGAARR